MTPTTKILLDGLRAIYSDSGPAMSLRATAGRTLEAYDKAAAEPSFVNGSRGELILRIVQSTVEDDTKMPEAAELAARIARAIDLHERREIAAMGSPFMALTSLIQYADWTISDESPGYHPTMPSAVAAAKGALRGLARGLMGMELDPSIDVPLVTMPLPSEDTVLNETEIAERKAVGTAMVRALLAAGFTRDKLRVNPDLIAADLIGNPLSEDEVLLDKLLTVEQEVFGLKAGDCPEPFADYDRACELNRMLSFCTTALRNRVQAGYGRVPDVAEAATLTDPEAIIDALLSLWQDAYRVARQSVHQTSFGDFGLVREARSYLINNSGDEIDLIKRLCYECGATVTQANWRTRLSVFPAEQAAIDYLARRAAKAEPAKPVAEEDDALLIVSDLLSLWRRARQAWGKVEDLTDVEYYAFAHRYVSENKPLTDEIARDLIKELRDGIEDDIRASGWKTCFALTQEGQRAEAWLRNHPE